jgi:hypothetical protein
VVDVRLERDVGEDSAGDIEPLQPAAQTEKDRPVVGGED